MYAVQPTYLFKFQIITVIVNCWYEVCMIYNLADNAELSLILFDAAKTIIIFSIDQPSGGPQ